MTSADIFIILHDILSSPVALLLDNHVALLTLVGWNAGNSDLVFLT